MKRFIVLGAGALMLALSAGCKTTGEHSSSRSAKARPAALTASMQTVTNTLDPDLLKPGETPFTLGPGDSIDIELWSSPLSRALTVVGPDGKIYYNVLPGLDVWGLTLQQTTDLLNQELGKYVNSPHVSVTLRSVGSKFVWVLGRLNRPGIYPLTGPTRLLELFAQAGGPQRTLSSVTTEDLADLRHSFIVRDGQFLPVDFYRLVREGDASQNIYVRPGDFVYVPSTLSQEVYVLGAVRLPAALPYTERMSLISAIAGGTGMQHYSWISAAEFDPGPFTKDAWQSHVAILRGSLAKPQMAVVDFNAIVHGKAPDVLLEPGDIVYVPNSPYTTLKRYFNIILNAFVTTVAANEGIRAGGGTAGVGVSVPVGGR
jgi:protein involved in polysaccharide export with SLBB domain